MKTIGINRMYSVAMPWLLAAAVFVLGYGSDIWVPSIRASEYIELGDDLFLAIIVGVVGSWWLRKRNRQMTDKLRRVANINHLIRNELEVILYSAHGASTSGNIKHIEQSVGQISWILRELLGADYTTAEPAVAARAQTAGAPGYDVKTG
jgi:hypothetical protein